MLYYIEKVIRLLLLVFSFYGFLQAARKRIDLNLCPALIFASIGSAMFMAGILNILPEAAAVICLLGCALGVRSILRRDRVTALLSPGMLFFAAGCAFFAALLFRAEFTHYDNFSHWGIVVKQMITDDRFPNFLNNNIEFQSYPLGSAAFIYYIARVSGIRFEWMQMLSQAVLMLGMVTSLFAFAKRPAVCLLTAFAGVVLLAGDVSFTSLLVDTLLPLTAVAGMAVCVFYRDNIFEKRLALVPFLLFLMSIKNSGLLFDAILLCFMLVCGRRTLRAHLRSWGMIALSPFALLFLWQKHVRLVFSNGMSAKHSLSLNVFASTFSGKDAETIRTITDSLLRQVLSASNGMLWLLLLLLALFLIARFCLRIREAQGALLVTALLSYAAYETGLFLMYLLTMPANEALILAGYARYEKTILIFVAGLAWISVCLMLRRTMPGMARAAASALLAALCGFTVFSVIRPSASYFKRQSLAGTTRAAFDQLIEDYDIPAGYSYMILRSENDDGYLYYLTRYLLNPQAVSSAEVSWLIDIPDLFKDYDYLITLDPSEETQSYLREHFELSPFIDLAPYKDAEAD